MVKDKKKASKHFPINSEIQNEIKSKRMNWYLVSFLCSAYFRAQMENASKS